MIERSELLARIRRALKRSRVVALIGPRQSGKTTLAREIVPADSSNYFDLENPARLEQPLTALEGLRGTVVIDEIQHRSDLFPILRVLADRRPLPARFLILGNASPELLRQSSESLAGRLETIPVTGLGLAEVGTKALNRHWQRCGFPLSFLARTHEDSAAWRQQFLQTILKVVEPDEAYFWATHQGAELDLLLFKGGRRFGVEIKRMDAPTFTPSMRIALADLQLEHLTVVYPGRQSYELGPEVTVLPIDTAVAAGIDGLMPRRRSRARVKQV